MSNDMYCEETGRKVWKCRCESCTALRNYEEPDTTAKMSFPEAVDKLKRSIKTFGEACGKPYLDGRHEPFPLHREEREATDIERELVAELYYKQHGCTLNPELPVMLVGDVFQVGWRHRGSTLWNITREAVYDYDDEGDPAHPDYFKFKEYRASRHEVMGALLISNEPKNGPLRRAALAVMREFGLNPSINWRLAESPIADLLVVKSSGLPWLRLARDEVMRHVEPGDGTLKPDTPMGLVNSRMTKATRDKLIDGILETTRSDVGKRLRDLANAPWNGMVDGELNFEKHAQLTINGIPIKLHAEGDDLHMEIFSTRVKIHFVKEH